MTSEQITRIILHTIRQAQEVPPQRVRVRITAGPDRGDVAVGPHERERRVAAVWTGGDADALRRDLLRLTYCV